MTRLLFFVALAVFGVIAARRWLQKLDAGARRDAQADRDSRRPPLRVSVRDHSVEKVICANCSAEYHPAQTAWQCPKCKQ